MEKPVTRLSYQLIQPTRDDFGYHCQQLKPAFDGLNTPKAEFDSMIDALKAKQASFYHVKAQGVHMRFVGQARDGDYHLWAMSGKGFLQAAPLVIERIKQCGYQSVVCHTCKAGIRRFYERMGFQEIAVIDDKTDERCFQLAFKE